MTTLFSPPDAPKWDTVEISLVDFTLIVLLTVSGLAALLGAALLMPVALWMGIHGGLGLFLFFFPLPLAYTAAAWHSAFRVYRNPNALPPLTLVCSLACLLVGYLLWFPAMIVGMTMLFTAVLFLLRADQDPAANG